MTAIDLSQLDPGIRETVRLLRSWGFATCDSGDGRSKAAERRNLDVPHVFMQVHTGEICLDADRLYNLLRSRGVPVAAQGPDDGTPYIAASYDPGSGTAIMALIGVDDAMLERAQDDQREWQ